MQVIKFKRKVTSAKTTYVELSKESRAWLFAQLDDVLALMIGCRHSNDPAFIQIHHFLCSPDKNLPKRTIPKNSLNSLMSFAEGVDENFRRGTQRDLSTKTMKGLVHLFKVMAVLFDTLEIEFEEGSLGMYTR
jgi:hypothetical protein